MPHSLSTTSAYGHGFPYYDDPGSPIMDHTRGGVVGPSGVVHGPRVARSGRVPLRSGYNTLDGRMTDPMMDPRMGAVTTDPYLMRDPMMRSDPMRDPMRDPRDRSLDRNGHGPSSCTYQRPLS